VTLNKCEHDLLEAMRAARISVWTRLGSSQGAERWARPHIDELSARAGFVRAGLEAYRRKQFHRITDFYLSRE
jgi:hypothetical protein